MNWAVLTALMLISGLILLLFEIFVVPGFGPVGVGAIIFLGVGIYLSWTKLSYAWGLAVTFISIFSIVLSIYLLKRMGVVKKFVLSKNVDDESHPEGENRMEDADSQNQRVSVEDKGITISDLRPSGIAEFDNNRINVIADGIYIKRGTQIKIVRIEGNRIFVEEL